MFVCGRDVFLYLRLPKPPYRRTNAEVPMRIELLISQTLKRSANI